MVTGKSSHYNLPRALHAVTKYDSYQRQILSITVYSIKLYINFLSEG